MQNHNNTRERKLRRQLAKQDCVLRKSRVKNTHYLNEGGYMIVDLYSNSVVQGGRPEYFV